MLRILTKPNKLGKIYTTEWIKQPKKAEGENQMLKKGDKAPEFNLKDQFGEEVVLSKLKGKKVLLSWHPLAFTATCTDQMRSLERNYDRLKEAGIDVVLGISADARPSKAVWAKAISLKNVLILADFEPKGEMSKAYGIYIENKGTSGRANIIVAEDGLISFAKEYGLSELPDVEEVIKNA